jgi:glutaredoxin 2
LLEIELKNSEKDKGQLILELEEERNYAKNLEKEVDNLEKLVDGEKRLNEKLDRELYTLINATK